MKRKTLKNSSVLRLYGHIQIGFINYQYQTGEYKSFVLSNWIGRMMFKTKNMKLPYKPKSKEKKMPQTYCIDCGKPMTMSDFFYGMLRCLSCHNKTSKPKR